MKHRWTDSKPIKTILFCTTTLVVAAFSLTKPNTDYSAFENRILDHVTMPDVDGIISGEWFVQFETANLDQIVGRNFLIELNSRVLRLLGKNEINNGIVVGKNCLLQGNNEITDYDSEVLQYREEDESVNKTLNTLCKIKDITDKYGGQLFYLNIYPRASFMWDRYPYPNEDIVKRNDEINRIDLKLFKSYGIAVVDTYDVFKKHADEYLFFNTDHHYTQKGAYYSYCELLDAINRSSQDKSKLLIPEWDEMNYTKVNKIFVGSLIQQIGDTQYEKLDYLEYALPKDYPTVYERFEFGEPSDLPIIRDETTTEYSWFMNGDNGNTVIKTHRDELSDILIIGYSYTDALEVFAIYNFNEMHSIDPRRFDGNIYEYIEDNQIDYVVVQGECSF